MTITASEGWASAELIMAARAAQVRSRARKEKSLSAFAADHGAALTPTRAGHDHHRGIATAVRLVTGP